MELRNYCYNRKIFKIRSYNIPVISVGNITAGGTGKTPFTIFLAEYFIKQGKKVAIVSRGYGRKSKGLQLVSDGKAVKPDPFIHGDEPSLMAKRLPETVIAVSEKRYLAMEYVIKNFAADVIILDDGFQHRSVRRDLDIVLLKEWDEMASRFVIPAGLLREFRLNLARADIVINTSPGSNNNADYQANFFIENVYNYDFKMTGKLSDYRGKRAIAFSGIAKPDIFFNALISAEIKLLKKYAFRDHYYFTQNDFDNMLSECSNNDIQYLFCTEKDLVKIHSLKDAEQKLKSQKTEILIPRLEIKLNDEKSFFENLQSSLD